MLFLFVSGCNELNSQNNLQYSFRVEDEAVPKTKQEFWSLANRMWVPSDFNNEWLNDTYKLQIGTDYVSELWPIQTTLHMSVCVTRSKRLMGRGRQNAFCLSQELAQYDSVQEADKRFEEWQKNQRWKESTDKFDFEKKVDRLSLVCGEGVVNEFVGFFEPFNFCLVKMRHGIYFIDIDFAFPLDEEPISYEEFGELLTILQDRIIDPNADMIPVGVEAPIPLIDG
ncbi:MAG: hypothetical protein AAF633_24825 [Chloroflexota bacterium]